jgi:two-component system, LytTR family, sensor kinase
MDKRKTFAGTNEEAMQEMPARAGAGHQRRAAGARDQRAELAADGPGSPGKARRALLLFVIWTVVGAFTAWDWLLSPMAAYCPFPERLAASAFFNAYLWALLTPTALSLASRFNPDQGARVPRVLLLLAIALGGALAVTFVEAGVHLRLHPMTMMGSEATDAWTRVWELTTRWYSREVMTFGVVLAAGLAIDSSRRHRARQRETLQLQSRASQLQADRAELQAQSAELSARLAEARLAALRTRLNPHFLFNTLNAVSALVAEDPRGVRNMIALLSELLRHSLQDSREQEIPLHEELRLLGLYLEIMEIRYEGQLRTTIRADAEVQEALVPNLILQPLVENAVKHGTDRAGGYGTIEVRAYRAGNELVLSVRDTGPGDHPELSKDGGGVGLRLTRERLAEHYGSEQRLDLERGPDGGMTARIALPFHADESARRIEEYAQL